MRHFIVFAFLGIQTSFVLAAQPENCSGKDCSQNSSTSTSGQQQQGSQTQQPASTGAVAAPVAVSPTLVTQIQDAPFKKNYISAAIEGFGRPTENEKLNKLFKIPVRVSETGNKQIDSAIGLQSGEYIEGADLVEPRLLDRIRNEMNRLKQNDFNESQKDGWFKHTNKKFAPETVTFFIANGLVIYEAMWEHSHGDPLKMQKHIDSLKDPISNLSFYTFMQTNGFYMHTKTKGLPNNIDPFTKSKMMTRFSYQGLAYSSLASSLISDIFSPYKSCLEKVFNTDNRFKKRLEEQCAVGLNSAWSGWTVRNKFTQYAPQIVSLVIGQKIASIAELTFKNKMTKLTRSELLKVFSNSAGKSIFKITGVDIAMVLAPEGAIYIKGINWLGKVVQISTFLEVSEVINNHVYRGLNNLIRPTTFSFDVMKINRLWNNADTYRWDLKTALIDNTSCASQLPNCHDISEIPNEIENFSVQTQQWREHLNAQNEQDLAGWLEFSVKILNQISLSYSFYENYFRNLFDTLNVYSDISAKRLPPEAVVNNTLYPYRQLPLYGVHFPKDKESKKVSILNQYLLSPQHMEKYQLEYIETLMNNVKDETFKQYSKTSQLKWQSIARKLRSKNANTISVGLIELNSLIGIYKSEKDLYESRRYEPLFIENLALLRNEIGDPLPILSLGASFSQAFTANSAYSEISTNANFRLSSNTYGFNKDADLFIYNMICGHQKGEITDNLLLSDNFLPPQVILPNNKPIQICNSAATHISSSNLYSMPLTNENTHKNYKNITEYIISHMNYEILGDITNKNDKVKFDKWWVNSVKDSTKPRLADFDKKFNILVAKTQDAIFGTKNANHGIKSTVGSFFYTALDYLNFSDYLPKTIFETFKFEIEVYLDLAQSIISSETTVYKTNSQFSYLKKAKENSSKTNSAGIYSTRSAELNELNNLFVSYFEMMKPGDIKFEDYHELSKKILSQIDKIKLLAKIAVTGKPPTSSQLFNNDQKTESKNQTKTVCSDEDAFSTDTSHCKEISVTQLETQNEVSITDIDENIKPFNIKQKSAKAVINGLLALESEVRRFIRMKILLSQSFELDIQEFMSDINNTKPGQKQNTKIQTASPRGG